MRSGNECIEKRGARHAANQFAAILSRELAQAAGEKESAATPLSGFLFEVDQLESDQKDIFGIRRSSKI